MNNKTLIERLAIACGIAIIIAASWFWNEQVGDVLETLRLAYPEDE
jgi:hypothetical protein